MLQFQAKIWAKKRVSQKTGFTFDTAPLHSLRTKVIQNCKLSTMLNIDLTAQIAKVVRRSLLVREVGGSNLEPIKSPTRCQRLATVATLMCEPWAQAAEMGTAHS